MRNSKLVQHYYLGSGAIGNLKELIDKKRSGNNDFIVFVIDHFFQNKSIVSSLPVNEIDLTLYADTTDEPRAEYIDDLVLLVKQKKQLPVAIIGIGGGSTLDIAKAKSILLTN